MFEFQATIAVRERSTGPLVTTPEACFKFLEPMGEMSQECFTILTLNTKNRVIHKHLISLGTLNSSLVHPRETFRPAILDSAAAIILAHNHPSGDPTPSAEDIKVTKQLIHAGEIMGIKVLDHVIIGSTDPGLFQPFLSLREAGLVEFK